MPGGRRVPPGRRVGRSEQTPTSVTSCFITPTPCACTESKALSYCSSLQGVADIVIVRRHLSRGLVPASAGSDFHLEQQPHHMGRRSRRQKSSFLLASAKAVAGFAPG